MNAEPGAPRVFVIHGSMRRGNTWQLTQRVIERLRERGVTVTEAGVSDLQLPFCESCHMCFEKGERFCPHSDITGLIARELMACDGLILSGVIYSLHLNAAMKNVIDHFSYLFHRPCLFDKKGLAITTTAGAAEKKLGRYLKSTMGYWGVGHIDTLSCKLQTLPFSLSEKQEKRMRKATDAFYDALTHDKKASPSFDSVVVHNAFRGMSSTSVVPSACDQAYWHDTGLVNKVYPRRIGVLKTLLGAFVCRVMRGRMKQITDNEEPIVGNR